MALICPCSFFRSCFSSPFSAESPGPCPSRDRDSPLGDLASDPTWPRYCRSARPYVTQPWISAPRTTVPAGWAGQEGHHFRSPGAFGPSGRLSRPPGAERGSSSIGGLSLSPGNGHCPVPAGPQETLVRKSRDPPATPPLRGSSRHASMRLPRHLPATSPKLRGSRNRRASSSSVLSDRHGSPLGSSSTLARVGGHNGVLLRFRESERAALAKWQPGPDRFYRDAARRCVAPLTSILFPDPLRKCLTTARPPADLVSGGADVDPRHGRFGSAGAALLAGARRGRPCRAAPAPCLRGP